MRKCVLCGIKAKSEGQKCGHFETYNENYIDFCEKHYLLFHDNLNSNDFKQFLKVEEIVTMSKLKLLGISIKRKYMPKFGGF